MHRKQSHKVVKLPSLAPSDEETLNKFLYDNLDDNMFEKTSAVYLTKCCFVSLNHLEISCIYVQNN
jgi:hypothetical protein